MTVAFIILHVVIAFFLVLVVLIQGGKGSDIGAAFGGGASQTMFGARGATTVLHKITSGLAIGFMATSLILAVLSGQRTSRSVIPDEPAKPPAPASVPAGAQKAPPGPAAAGAPGTAPSPAPPPAGQPAPPAAPTKP
jgi:preprotein translocase subunit SecG